MKKKLLVFSFLIIVGSISYSQLTLDKKEIIVGMSTGAHYQKGAQAPIWDQGGSNVYSFGTNPGAFYRVGITAEYVFKGFHQVYTKNKASMYSFRLGFDKGITKHYTMGNILEIISPTELVPVKAKCKFWDLYLGYIIRKPKGKFTLGYGFNALFYRFNCYPIYLTVANPNTKGEFYLASNYGFSPMLLAGITHKQWNFELNGEVQWLWNHNVLGFKYVENEPPFFERLKTYSNLYALARLSVGYRINLNKR